MFSGLLNVRVNWLYTSLTYCWTYQLGLGETQDFKTLLCSEFHRLLFIGWEWHQCASVPVTLQQNITKLIWRHVYFNTYVNDKRARDVDSYHLLLHGCQSQFHLHRLCEMFLLVAKSANARHNCKNTVKEIHILCLVYLYSMYHVLTSINISLYTCASFVWFSLIKSVFAFAMPSLIICAIVL